MRIGHKIAIGIVATALLALFLFIGYLGVKKLFEVNPLGMLRQDGLEYLVEIHTGEQFDAQWKALQGYIPLEKYTSQYLPAVSLDDMQKDLHTMGVMNVYILGYKDATLLVIPHSTGEVSTQLEEQLAGVLQSYTLPGVTVYANSQLDITQYRADDQHQSIASLPRPDEWTQQSLIFTNFYDNSLLLQLLSQLDKTPISKEMLLGSIMEQVGNIDASIYVSNGKPYIHTAFYPKSSFGAIFGKATLGTGEISMLLQDDVHWGVFLSSAKNVSALVNYATALENTSLGTIAKSYVDSFLKDQLRIVDVEDFTKNHLPQGSLGYLFTSPEKWTWVFSSRIGDMVDRIRSIFLYTYGYIAQEKTLKDGSSTLVLSLDTEGLHEDSVTMSGSTLRELRLGDQIQYDGVYGDHYIVTSSTGTVVEETADAAEKGYFPYGASFAGRVNRQDVEGITALPFVPEVTSFLWGGRLLDDRVTFTVYPLSQ